METIGHERALPVVMSERIGSNPVQFLRGILTSFGGYVDRKLDEMVCSAYDFTDGEDD